MGGRSGEAHPARGRSLAELELADTRAMGMRELERVRLLSEIAARYLTCN
jgi:hypothetical protein